MNIIIVDDDQDLLDELRMSFTRAGAQVTKALSAKAALSVIEADASKFNLLLTDVRMPGIDGLTFARQVSKTAPHLPFAIMSGHADFAMALQVVRLGAIDLLPKPFGMSVIRELLERARQLDAVGDCDDNLELVDASYSLTLKSNRDEIGPTVERFTHAFAGVLAGANKQAVKLAMVEALNNAVIHGSFGVSSELKNEGQWEEFESQIVARQADPMLAKKLVTVTGEYAGAQLKIVITDEGMGFDATQLPDPTDPLAMLASGRGIMMIRMSMDDVSWNTKGNQIVMLKTLS